MPTLDAIYAYPLKSARAMALSSANLDTQGLPQDRRLVIVNQRGVVVTQKDCPALTKIQADLVDEHITLTAAGMPVYQQSIQSAGNAIKGQFYFDQVTFVDQGDAAARWLSNALDQPVRLATSLNAFERRPPSEYQIGRFDASQQRFAYMGHVLITNTASLADLNSKLADPLPMDRFRPNLVINTDLPFVEDQWLRFRIGAAEFEGTMTCERCIMTTQDQSTGQRGKEPLRTLSKYRKFSGGMLSGIVFGIYANVVVPGTINVGDSLELLEQGAVAGATQQQSTLPTP